ncbi:MAG: hypothetical protein R2932_01040 [Caldilineaceae bacterium]
MTAQPPAGTLTITAVGKPQFGGDYRWKERDLHARRQFRRHRYLHYVVSDGKGGISTGSVTVTVTGPEWSQPTADNTTKMTAQRRRVV